MDSMSYTLIAISIAALVAIVLFGVLLWATQDEATQKLPETARVSVARLKPGDVVVIEYPGAVSPDAAVRLSAQARNVWPHNSVCIVESGGRVKVIEAAIAGRNPPPPASDVGGLAKKGL